MDLLFIHNSPDLVAAKTQILRDALLRESGQIRQPNFTVIGADDLVRLFGLYDEAFFDGWLNKAMKQSSAPLTLRLSSTMTRASGKTIRHSITRRGAKPQIRYEIVIASRLLFLTFGNIQRPVVVSGLSCADRLQALQRIMEHEIIHLAEFLNWGRSSCSARRYKTLAWNIFGHTGTKHDLVTPRERAATEHGIKIGSPVVFELGGTRLAGWVNRIHHRATVLVEAADGKRYTDGKKYKKFYVPVPALRVGR